MKIIFKPNHWNNNSGNGSGIGSRYNNSKSSREPKNSRYSFYRNQADSPNQQQQLDLYPGHYPAPFHLLKYFPKGIPSYLMYNPDFVYGILYPQSSGLSEQEIKNVELRLQKLKILENYPQKQENEFYSEVQGWKGQLPSFQGYQNVDYFPDVKPEVYPIDSFAHEEQDGYEISSFQKNSAWEERNNEFASYRFNCGRKSSKSSEGQVDDEDSFQGVNCQKRRVAIDQIKLKSRKIDGFYQ